MSGLSVSQAELSALEDTAHSLLEVLHYRLNRVLDKRNKNFQAFHQSDLHVGRPEYRDDDSPSNAKYGTDETTKENIKYLTSKYTVLANTADYLGVTARDKKNVSIDDEERIFIESKILMEELKQSNTLISDQIHMKMTNIDRLNRDIKVCDQKLDLILNLVGKKEPKKK